MSTLLSLLILMPLAAAYVRLVRRERRRREWLDFCARVERARVNLAGFALAMQGFGVAMADAAQAMTRLHKAFAAAAGSPEEAGA